jgi:hypothetical protein
MDLAGEVMTLKDKIRAIAGGKEKEPSGDVLGGIGEHVKALKEVAESNRRLAYEMKDLRDWVEKLKIAVDSLNVTMERRRIY